MNGKVSSSQPASFNPQWKSFTIHSLSSLIFFGYHTTLNYATNLKIFFLNFSQFEALCSSTLNCSLSHEFLFLASVGIWMKIKSTTSRSWNLKHFWNIFPRWVCFLRVERAARSWESFSWFHVGCLNHEQFCCCAMKSERRKQRDKDFSGSENFIGLPQTWKLKLCSHRCSLRDF